MNYGTFILLVVIIAAFTLLFLLLYWAIRDMQKVSDKEIEKLTTGDRVTIKTISHGYTTGRIVYLNKMTGKGFLKPKGRHGIDFHTSQIKSLA